MLAASEWFIDHDKGERVTRLLLLRGQPMTLLTPYKLLLAEPGSVFNGTGIGATVRLLDRCELAVIGRTRKSRSDIGAASQVFLELKPSLPEA